MKLFTEDQVTKLTEAAFVAGLNNNKFIFGVEFEKLTPIEIPSDEEIDKYLKSFPYTKHLDDGQYNDGVIDGAELGIEWLKNKIQGGNK
jgi:hypothetical protein